MIKLKLSKPVVMNDTIVGYTVRGSLNADARLTRFVVVFVNAKGQAVNPALHPKQIHVKAADLDIINAIPKEVGEKTASWVERVTKDFIIKNYNVVA